MFKLKVSFKALSMIKARLPVTEVVESNSMRMDFKSTKGASTITKYFSLSKVCETGMVEIFKALAEVTPTVVLPLATSFICVK